MGSVNSVRAAYGLFLNTVDTVLAPPLYPSLKVKPVDLSVKTVIVTGSNVGIGLETARKLASFGAHVVLACRSKEKAEVARKDIVETTGSKNVEVRIVDFGSFASVRKFVEEWGGRPVDVLVNNAGVYPARYEVGEDGYELSFTTLLLSQILFTHLLLPSLTTNARIVNVASAANYFCTRDMLDLDDLDATKWIEKEGVKKGELFGPTNTQKVYNKAKVSQIIWSRVLRERLATSEEFKGRGIVVVTCHPGLIKSSIFVRGDGPSGEHADNFKTLKKLVDSFGLSTEQGACTPVFLAVDPKVKPTSGIYWDRQSVFAPNALTFDQKLGEEHYAAWLKACGLQDV
ncbi:hypothetical protein MNV49_007639 [Pseudohyphozyma bogoriensis]|nr:hypothetical protein MNV49_007639 [Pseudohyphozyma bogoriensis]